MGLIAWQRCDCIRPAMHYGYLNRSSTEWTLAPKVKYILSVKAGHNLNFPMLPLPCVCNVTLENTCSSPCKETCFYTGSVLALCRVAVQVSLLKCWEALLHKRAAAHNRFFERCASTCGSPDLMMSFDHQNRAYFVTHFFTNQVAPIRRYSYRGHVTWPLQTGSQTSARFYANNYDFECAMLKFSAFFCKAGEEKNPA